MKKLLILSALILLSACAEASPASGKCVVGGCSGQLCVEKGQSDMSTCEWTAAYACYKQFGKCEEQSNGSCGWTQSYDLSQCLKDPENYTSNALRPETQGDPFGDRRNPWLRP